MAHLCQFRPEKLVRNLGKNTRAVARLGVSIHRAAMNQGARARERTAQDQVRALAVDVGYKTHTARVVLVRGTIESLEAREVIVDGLIERHGVTSLNW